MSSKIKFVFGASVLGILGIFTFKIFFTSNDEYLFENKSDEVTQQVISPELDVQGGAKNSLTEIQNLEKNTNQEVDKQFKSEVLSSPKKNHINYQHLKNLSNCSIIIYLPRNVCFIIMLLIVMEALIII